MKKLALVLALVTGAALTSQAQAQVPAVAWGCKLKAKLVQTTSSVELLVIRGETVIGQGVAACADAFGRVTKQKVDVVIQSGGIGPAINGPLQGLTIYAARVGVANVRNMIGTYQLQAGPRIGLIGARVGVMAGAQIAGDGVGAGVEAVIENRFSVGLDLGGMAMAVVPRGQGYRVRF